MANYTLIPDKGLQVVSPDPTGDAGLAINNDLKYIADRLPKEHGVICNGGGTAPSTGFKGRLQVATPGVITSWTVVADAVGNAVFDIRKSTYANYPATTSIVASAPPTLSGTQKSESSILTGWTTSISEGDILEFYLTSVDTLTNVCLTVKIQ